MKMSQDLNRRHSPNRRRTRVPASVEVDGTVLEATVLDVSFEGMRLQIDVRLAPGTPVRITTLGVSVPAILHWCANGQAGVHLLERLDRDILVALETADDDLAEYR